MWIFLKISLRFFAKMPILLQKRCAKTTFLEILEKHVTWQKITNLRDLHNSLKCNVM